MAGPTIKGLLEKLAERDERIAALEKDNALLQQKVDALVRKIFGSSSEPFNPNQPDLFGFTGEQAAEEAGKVCASFLGEASHEGSVRSFVFEVGFLLLFWSGFLKARERLQVPPKPRGYGGAQPPFQSRQALFLNLSPNWIAN